MLGRDGTTWNKKATFLQYKHAYVFAPQLLPVNSCIFDVFIVIYFVEIIQQFTYKSTTANI